MRNLMMFTFSVFDHKYISWANLVQKLFKLKFDTKVNSNMQNSMMVSILSTLEWKQLPFLDKFGPKNRSCQFKLKIGT